MAPAAGSRRVAGEISPDVPQSLIFWSQAPLIVDRNIADPGLVRRRRFEILGPYVTQSLVVRRKAGLLARTHIAETFLMVLRMSH